MPSIEQHSENYFNATFYTSCSVTATWQYVQFTNHKGEEFGSTHIRLFLSGANAVDYSFDPRNVDAATRVIQGVIDSNDKLIELRDKHATGIWVKTATTSTLRIHAWR